MAWKLDFLDYETLDFSLELNDVILPLYKIADDKLTELEVDVRKKLQAELSNPQDESDALLASQIAGYEEENIRLRRQAIGALALDLVCSSLKLIISRLKRHFDKTHPPENRYSGSHWLARVREEFRRRFDIDFGRTEPLYLRIEELFLARNAGVHREGDAIGEYLQKVPNPRFIDDRKEFCVTWDRLQEATSDASGFVSWIVKNLKELPASSSGG